MNSELMSDLFFEPSVYLEPYPPGYVLPKFDLFDVRSYRAFSQIQFQTQCVDTVHNPILMRQFRSSLTKVAFTWFSRLEPESIKSWEQLCSLFCKRFDAIRKEVTLDDLRRCRQEKDELFATLFVCLIERLRTVVMQLEETPY